MLARCLPLRALLAWQQHCCRLIAGLIPSHCCMCSLLQALGMRASINGVPVAPAMVHDPVPVVETDPRCNAWCCSGVEQPGRGSVTLEPGGQLELSGAPLANLHDTCAELQQHLDLVGGSREGAAGEPVAAP